MSSQRPQYTREDAIRLLRHIQESLIIKGENRYPKRSDFNDEEVAAIKSFLGPWPRALESAGIKPPREGDRLLLNKQKRIRAKQKRREIFKSRKKEPTHERTNEK